jgi:hypothetical protein
VERFREALGRAGKLRAVVLEWIPEATGQAAAAQFAGDFARARSMLC